MAGRGFFVFPGIDLWLQEGVACSHGRADRLGREQRNSRPRGMPMSPEPAGVPLHPKGSRHMMNPTEGTIDAGPVMPAPDALEMTSSFINEHGAYEDWSKETRQAYADTVNHAASFGTL